MSNDFPDMSGEVDNFQIKKPNTGLAEQQAKARAINENAVKMLLAKSGPPVNITTLFGEKGFDKKATQTLMEDTSFEDIPIGETTISQNSQATIGHPPLQTATNTTSGEVNKEHEPKNIKWTKTDIPTLMAIYPQEHAVSSVRMVIGGALQQPGFSFTLLAGHGTQYLVKSDEKGNLYMGQPSKDSQAFSNIGLNPDFDGDKDDKGKNAIKPMWKSESLMESEELDSTFRECSASGKRFKKLEKIIKKDKIEENTVSLKELNSLLFLIQEASINHPKAKKADEEADTISEIIAEGLLTNRIRISRPDYQGLLQKYRNWK